MANPDFVDESVSDQQGAGPITVLFPAAWSANQIALLFVASDGGQATLSTPNGFVLATDPLGNAAAANAGAGVCSITVFWKRLVGSNSTTDPAPVIAAASTWGGTCIATHINTYSNCRTSGTPFHIIASAVVSSATTSIAPPAVTPTLNGCTLVTCCTSENDDSAFNAWTFTGAASPTGQLDNGWHSPTGNLCSFTGGRGGYATAGGARSGTSTFGASTRQAQVTMVMASLNEIGALEDVPVVPGPTAIPIAITWSGADSDLMPIVSVIDDAPSLTVSLVNSSTPVIAQPIDEDLPSPSTPSSMIEDGQTSASHVIVQASLSSTLPAEDYVLSTVTIDDDPSTSTPLVKNQDISTSIFDVDSIPTGSAPSGFVDDTVSSQYPTWDTVQAYLSITPQEDLTTAATVSATIAAGGDAQRSFQIPPQTGTLTTAAPIASWAQSHAYVVDPTNGGINRVQNNGTLYQCSVAGNSASSGTGPNATTPGTTQTDNTVTWYVIGPVSSTDTTSGSQILVTVMRGNQSQTATVDPSDNDGGTYTAITNNAYVSFPASFAGVWRRTTASNAKANFAASAVWGGSGGAGDEQSVAWVRLDGVVVGAPHTFSHVERANATSGTVTAASITTTKRCLIVSFWHGNGTVQPAGQPDAATPAGGLVLVANATGPLSLTTSGYIQHMVAWRVTGPGTTAEVWTASPTNQGAQLNTIAYETLDQGGITEDGVGVTWGISPLVPTMGVHVAADEMPRALTGDDPPVGIPIVPLIAGVADAVAPDGLPIATPIDDERSMGNDVVLPMAALVTPPSNDDSLTASSPVDEPGSTIPDAVTPTSLPAPRAADDDITSVTDDGVCSNIAMAPIADCAVPLLPVETIGTVPDDAPATPDWRTFVATMIEMLRCDADELGAPPPPLPQIVDDDALQTTWLPEVPGLAWRTIYEEWLLASISPTPHAAIRVVVLDTATGVDMATTIFRQGSTHGPLEAVAYTASRLVDFPTEYPGGVTFRMVSGATVVTGPAVGDAAGRLTYDWGDHDLDIPGTYAAVFIGTDAQGHTETFPRGTNISITVIAAL